MKTRAAILIFLTGLLCMPGVSWKAHAQTSFLATNAPVTNLLQLVRLLRSHERLLQDVRLQGTVCAATDPAVGVVILQDATDTLLFEVGGGSPELLPGDVVSIQRTNCTLRRRDMGVQMSIAPVVDNNGIHSAITASGGTFLKAGRHPLTIEWFNRLHESDLAVRWQVPGSPYAEIPAANLSCAASGTESVQPGLRRGLLADCYEGDWERVPNFDLLEPLRTVVVTNIDSSRSMRNQMVGLRLRGFLDAPKDGLYNFTLRSADGSLLFIGDRSVPIVKIGKAEVPTPTPVTINEPLARMTRQQWVTVEGRVGSVSPAGRGAEIVLYSERNSLVARVADARGLNATNLLRSRIRVRGVGCALFNLQGDPMLGQVLVANARDVEIVRPPITRARGSSLLVKADQVQTLSLEEAKLKLPVQIRGVVTSKGRSYDAWLSAQDDTRGIFVDFHNTSNSVPMCGDFFEIIGHSGAGDFAPVVVADRLVRLGNGTMPEPIRPVWDELNNGSMDVQWVEIRGLVYGVSSNTLSMLLPAGQMQVQVEGPSSASLESLEQAVVRVRGVLFAVWNATREVRAGRILMRNASITVEVPAPADPFDAVLKTPRELLLFDAQATAFRRVKVRGQIQYSDSAQTFLEKDGAGLRLLPADSTNLKPGDLVEAVGYPNISKSVLLLREAIVRKTGEASLPPARVLGESPQDFEGLDSTRVRIEGKLLGWHLEGGKPVLEMQSGVRLFFARLAQGIPSQMSFRPGSNLALVGVYVDRGSSAGIGPDANSFELLLNSAADIEILSMPPWWTLPRLLILIGILCVVLIMSAVWITQLRRLVERRTRQLQKEIHEREVIEQQHALESERARIASDLHDDLGASLTEVSVLASSGQHSGAADQTISRLFHAIALKAREMVAALDTIVWAVDPKDNSLQSVADYLCDFVDEYLSPSGIVCRFEVPVALPPVMLDGRLRHDLFLAVKETLNNIVRHAQATKVHFRLSVEASQMQIVIVDNGKGFGADSPHAGKGLKNLPARLAKLGGSFDVKSVPGQGTTVTISLGLPAEVVSGH